MFKKIAALATAAVLCAGLMAGCGASGTTADTSYSAENPLVLTLAHGLSEAHTVHIARSAGDGGHGAGDGDVLRGVVDLGTIHAGGKEMVERGGGAVDGCRIIARCRSRSRSYRHGIACGSGQPFADAAPVGGQRNRAVLRMRGVVTGVFLVATGKQYRRSNQPGGKNQQSFV